MENYLLYGEIAAEAGKLKAVYKGRRRGTVQFCGLHKWNKTWKHLVTNEVRLIVSLRHSNVLQFREWYETSQHVWVVTELASGGSLALVLEQDGRVALGNVPDFLSDIAAGLNYLHSKSIIYCDLQPQKISLDSCQTLKLSDFTLAHKVGEKPPFTSHPLTMTCTPAHHSHTPPTNEGCSPSPSPSPFYMAPECLRGEAFSLNSDLWSLGCVTFELCTGMRPFQGSSPAEVLHNTSHQKPQLDLRDSQTVCAEVSSLVSALISGLLRPQSELRLSWQEFLSLFHSTQSSDRDS